VADRPVHRVRIVGEEDVALLNGPVVALQEAVDERAELADDHLAVEFAMSGTRRAVRGLPGTSQCGTARYPSRSAPLRSALSMMSMVTVSTITFFIGFLLR